MTDTRHPTAAGRARWLTPAAVVGLTSATLLLVMPVRELFVSEGVRWPYIPMLSFAVSFGLTPMMFRLWHRLGVVDQPAERKIHREPTSRIGGLAL